MSRSVLIAVVSVLMVVAIFALDSIMPLGVAGGVPYLIPILVSLRLRNTRFTYLLAVACSILTMIGLMTSPGGGEMWKVLSNRSLALLAIWASAVLSVTYINQLVRQNVLEKELEKITIHRKTISGVNHLVRNLQNNFEIINASKSIREEFGEDTIEMLNKSSREVELILDELGALEEITPENITKVAFSNIR